MPQKPFVFQFRKYLPLLVILPIVFLSFFPVLNAEFVQWDDDVHIIDNLGIRSLDFEHIRDIFSQRINKIYIPLTTLSFAIEYHFFGLDPFVYHLNNLILHLLVVVMAYCFALRLGLSVLGAAVAAVIFGVHPTHVESVAWVTERKDVLYALFYMGALLAYCNHINQLQENPNVRSYALAWTTLLGTLSMLAKPMALSLPGILVLLDWFLKRKMDHRAWVEKIPLCIVIGGLTLLTYSAHARVPGTTFIESLLLWSWCFTFYLKQFIFPFHSVVIFRPPAPISFTHLEYLLSFIALIVVVVSVVRFRRYPWYMFAFFFFFFSIFFLFRFDFETDINMVADRFLYLPSFGFCLWLGLEVQKLLEHKKRNYVISAMIALAILILVYSVRTFNQCLVWKDSIALWEHQLKHHPNDPTALNAMGLVLYEKEDFKEAAEEYKKIIQLSKDELEDLYQGKARFYIAKVNVVLLLYRKAIALDPSFIDAHYNIAQVYKDIGLFREALIAYGQVIKLDPKYEDAYYSLGNIYRDLGDVNRAIAAYTTDLQVHPEKEDIYINVILAYKKALEGSPDNLAYKQERNKVIRQLEDLVSKKPRATSYFNLGFIYSETGDAKKAILAYENSIHMNKNHSNSLYNLGNLYKDTGRLNEAIGVYERAIKTDPKQIDALINMGVVYSRQKKYKPAQEAYEEAIAKQPYNPKGYFNLAFLKETIGRKEDAIELYKKSAQYGPANAEAYYNMGNVYAGMQQIQAAIDSYKEAVEVSPQHVNALVNLSILYFQIKDYNNAIKYFDDARILGYDPPEGYIRALNQYRNIKEENINSTDQ